MPSIYTLEKNGHVFEIEADDEASALAAADAWSPPADAPAPAPGPRTLPGSPPPLNDSMGGVSMLADQMYRVFGGAVVDSADAITGLVNRPINSVLDLAGVDYQTPTNQFNDDVPDPVGAGGQLARGLAPFLFGAGPAAQGARALAGVPAQGARWAAPFVGGAATDAALAGVNESNLGNLIQDTTGVSIPTARQPGESPGVAALKDIVEGGIAGEVVDAVVRGIRGWRVQSGQEAKYWDLEVENPQTGQTFRASKDPFDEIAQGLTDNPDLNEVLKANGIDVTSDPRFQAAAERLAARRAAEAERAASPWQDLEATAPRPAEGPMRSPAAQAGANVDATIMAREAAAEQQAALQARAELPPADPDYVDPAFVPPAARAPAAPAPDQPLRVTPGGQAFDPNVGALRGQELRTPRNLPVPVEPPTPRMSDADIAQAQRGMEAGNVNRAPQQDVMAAPEGRAPQTRDDQFGQRQAEGAFDLADRQRGRVEPGVRDTQAGGLPEGPKAQRVLLDDGFPVRIVDMGDDGRVTVERYDPRTGAAVEGATPYEIPSGQLQRTNYTPEPRRAQDFGARDNPARMSPELPGGGREPTQTFRATAPDAPEGGNPFPGANGPDARPPLPDQPSGPMPGRAEPRGETRERRRAANEEELRQRYEQARGESQYQESARAARDRYAGSDSQFSNREGAQDDGGRYGVDEFGFVRSEKGGPIRFGDQKQAAKWILNVGHRKSPDQIFEVANHPKGGFTARETGRSAPDPDPPPAQGAPADASIGGRDVVEGPTRSTDPPAVRRDGDTTGSAALSVDQAAKSPGRPEDANMAPEGGNPKTAAEVEERAAFRQMAEESRQASERELRVRDTETFVREHETAVANAKAMSDKDLHETWRAAKDASDGVNDAARQGGRAERQAAAETRDRVRAARDALYEESRARKKPGGGTKLYSTPLDPDAIKELLVEPAMDGVKAALKALTPVAKSIREELMSGAANVKGLQHSGLVRAYDMLASTNGQAMRIIAGRYSGEAAKAIGELTDLVATNPGRGKVVAQTFERAVQEVAMGRANQLLNILGDLPEGIGKSKARAAQLGLDKEVADILAGVKRATPGTKAAETARRVRKLLDEHHDYLTKAGVDVGYAKGGYFPRVVDMAAVDANTDGFLKAAQRLYRTVGMDDGDAKEAAEAWLDRLRGVSDSAYAASTPQSKHTKGRTLPKEADKILADFYMRDPRTNLATYFRQTARAAEATRRFGVSGEKVAKLRATMSRNGVSRDDLARLQGHFDSATGSLYSTKNVMPGGIGAFAQTAGVLALLPRAVISSLVEGLAIGVRSGDAGAGLVAATDAFRELSKTARKRDDVRQLASMMGVIGDAMNELVIASQFGQEVPSKLLSRFFRATGLHAVTEAQRVAAARIGQGYIAQLLDEAVGGQLWKGKAIMRANPKRAKSAARGLRELGMDEATAKSVAAWAARDGGVLGVDKIMASTPEARAYRTALQRFVDESIQNPTAADRPLYANSPYGRMAYGITSFMFSFTKNVLARTAREGKEAFMPGYTLADRARFLAPAIALGVLTFAQGEVSDLREIVFNPQAKDERTTPQKMAVKLDRAGIFGNLSPFVNIAMSARYERDPSSLLTGAYLTAYMQNIGNMSIGLIPKEWGGPNSPNTNNAEWQAAKSFYQAIVTPLVSAGAATLSAAAPGGIAARVGIGAGLVGATSPGASRAFADAMVGERDVKPGGKTKEEAEVEEDEWGEDEDWGEEWGEDDPWAEEETA